MYSTSVASKPVGGNLSGIPLEVLTWLPLVYAYGLSLLRIVFIEKRILVIEMFREPVVFVDIETTGGSYRTSRVLEVAAIRVEAGQVVREFHSLVNPETHVPTMITRLTGITSDDVVDAPRFEDIADELKEVMDGAIFIAHNVRFDYSFLKAEFALTGIHFAPKLLCTVRLSRALYPQQQGHSLEKLIARHAIPVAARHRALDDTRAIHYFAQLAYEQHGEEAFAEAVAKQLKTQYLPSHLDMTTLDEIANVPGVYIFKDESEQPVYVGKSITLKKRVISHFQSMAPKEVKMSQRVHSVETIPTGSELAALLLESKLVKELQPLFNRMLRRQTSYALLVRQPGEYAQVGVVSGNVTTETDLATIYGIYPTRMKAKQRLLELTRTFDLCPKLMGLEKAKAACFSYALGKCRGACIGKEPAERYNRRFDQALEHSRIAEWPYDHAIYIPVNDEGERVVIQNWMIQKYVDRYDEPLTTQFEPRFDVDEYKILRRFVRENNQNIMFL